MSIQHDPPAPSEFHKKKHIISMNVKGHRKKEEKNETGE